MGSGITQTIAESGKNVLLIEVDKVQLNKSLIRIEKSLNKKAEKLNLESGYAGKMMMNIKSGTTIEEVSKSELIIEAVPEDIEVKKNIFKEITRHSKCDAIIASNTSGLSIAAIGSVTRNPENIIGLHFFYPAPIMNLVEIIPSIITSEDTYEIMYQFVKDLNKNSVRCQDYPGFLVNRMLVPMINEAIYCVMEGSTPEDVDASMMYGANHKMGPITLADFVGLDVLLATMEGLYEGFSDSKFRPAPLLKKLVESGNLGRKTGRGFYEY